MISQCIKTEEKPQINKLILYFKEIEKEEQTNLLVTRRREIIKL